VNLASPNSLLSSILLAVRKSINARRELNVGNVARLATGAKNARALRTNAKHLKLLNRKLRMPQRSRNTQSKMRHLTKLI